MAQERKPQKSIHDLRQEIAHSRDRLGSDLTGLGYELDFPLKFRKSFQRNTITWISSAVLMGVVVMARALAGSKKTVKMKGDKAFRGSKAEEQKKGLLEAGLAMGLLRFGATLLKPVIVTFVTKKIGSYAGRTR